MADAAAAFAEIQQRLAEANIRIQQRAASQRALSAVASRVTSDGAADGNGAAHASHLATSQRAPGDAPTHTRHAGMTSAHPHNLSALTKWVQVVTVPPSLDPGHAIVAGSVFRVIEYEGDAGDGAHCVIACGTTRVRVPASSLQTASTSAIQRAMQAEIESGAARRVEAMNNATHAIKGDWVVVTSLPTVAPRWGATGATVKAGDVGQVVNASYSSTFLDVLRGAPGGAVASRFEGVARLPATSLRRTTAEAALEALGVARVGAWVELTREPDGLPSLSPGRAQRAAPPSGRLSVGDVCQVRALGGPNAPSRASMRSNARQHAWVPLDAPGCVRTRSDALQRSCTRARGLDAP